ncbi:hypothetical protein DFH09DRAFT_934196, partial [Mycena vulgaris]
SRLEADVKARKKAADKKLHQKTLNTHLREKPEREIPCSDKLFRDVALEWLIATDQVSSALAHRRPKFIEMIDIAARATNGVKISSGKNTRQNPQ